MKKEMINRNNIWSRKAYMSYLQIAILIAAIFSFSYLLYKTFETDNSNENALINDEDNLKKLLVSGLRWLSKINFIESVDAQSSSRVCCEETVSGNSCQFTSSDQCNTQFKSAPTLCEDTSFCEIGCCLSENTGLCNQATSRRDCEKINGIFNQGAECNIQECKKGCCILGDQVKWTTEKNCQFEGNTENKDIKTEWRFDENSDTELECLFNVDKDEEGACVFESNGERKCVYITLEECVSRTGSEANFAKDTFCSDPALNNTCKAKNSTGCVEGEEDVYWFDSCGNKENIASDCNLFSGSYCREKNGEAACREVDCDTNGDGTIDRKNGESWCSYDGKIGNGKDPVGSRHVKHICYFGTERLAPCSDFRNEICVQEDSVTNDGKSFSQAACRVNQWRTCLSYNREGTDKMESQCKKNPDCWVKEIDMSGSFHFKVCLPSYPPGFDLNFEQDLLQEDGSLDPDYYRPSSADGICSSATQRCTETWKCGIFGCICIDNCDCHTEKFTKEMNDFCVSLGDCGAYVNYIGEYSDGGYTVRVVQQGEQGPPRLSSGALSAFKKFTGIQEQKPASPGNVEFFQSLDPKLLPTVEVEKTNLSAFEVELTQASGSYGSPLLFKILTTNDSELNFGNIPAGAIGLSRFSGAISSIQAAINSQIERTNEEQPKDLSMIIAMVAALIAYVITQSVIISMIAALLGFLFGLSWIKYVDIDFSCLPWEPPDGGDKCNECNKLDVPCTEYRCESLGSLCQLINKGTGNELCVSKPINETLPIITPFEKAITPGYVYKNVDSKGFEIANATSNECIEAYTSVQFGIKVDPFARCRISNNSREDYNEMAELFGPKGNYILPAHVTSILFPNPEAFKNYYNLTDAQIKELGILEFYIKCKTASGKVNPESYKIKTCVKPGPDLTPPRIVLAQPLSGGFVKYGEDEKEVIFYVNEPSECKWSDKNEDFDAMNNTMQCEKNPALFTQFGWKCLTSIKGITNTNNFFIKCRDTSENKNTMSESFSYELKKSESELSIDEIIPRAGEKVISGVSPVSVKLRARTSGGAQDGEAICSWKSGNYQDSFIYKNANGSESHEYILNLLQGSYNIELLCKDIAGNNAVNTTRFDIYIDKFGPKINRIYYDQGLKIVTSEPASCRYSFNRRYDYENATKMSGFYNEYYAPWYLRTYYIQCVDDYGNKGTITKIKPFV